MQKKHLFFIAGILLLVILFINPKRSGHHKMTLHFVNNHGQSIKVSLSEEICERLFDHYDKYIAFLDASGKVDPRDIQAYKNKRDISYIQWKTPERFIPVRIAVAANMGVNYKPGRSNAKLQRESLLIGCYNTLEGQVYNMGLAKTMNLATISQEDFYKLMRLQKISSRRDENLHPEYKKLLGRP